MRNMYSGSVKERIGKPAGDHRTGCVLPGGAIAMLTARYAVLDVCDVWEKVLPEYDMMRTIAFRCIECIARHTANERDR